jgi:hypothetical protein
MISKIIEHINQIGILPTDESIDANKKCFVVYEPQSEIMNHITGNNMAHCLSKPWDSEELILLVRNSIS